MVISFGGGGGVNSYWILFCTLFQVVEFIAVLLTTGSEAAEKVLIDLGAIKCILDLFFQ